MGSFPWSIHAKEVIPIELSERQKRLWAEVDLDAAAYNFRKIPGPVCCVIKANAYGHGAVVLARLYEKLGAAFFAVSNIEEAIQLRLADITKPILILGYTSPECAVDLQEYRISQCVYSLTYAQALSDACVRQNTDVTVHIKMDTGMGRLGFQYRDGISELDDAVLACQLPRLHSEGIFTHFAVSDEGINDFTAQQANRFNEAVRYIEDRTAKFTYRHCSNSAAIFSYPEYHMDLVRAGIVLYGIDPTPGHASGLKPVLSLKSVVSHVKTVRRGDSVSYGRDFIAEKDTTVVTVPVGYADGYWRSNAGGSVYINGKRCPILGRICMDQLMAECDNAQIGDAVELYGEHITVNEIAAYNNTIPYEILCAIGERVPRVYLQDGKAVEIVDNIL